MCPNGGAALDLVALALGVWADLLVRKLMRAAEEGNAVLTTEAAQLREKLAQETSSQRKFQQVQERLDRALQDLASQEDFSGRTLIELAEQRAESARLAEVAEQVPLLEAQLEEAAETIEELENMVEELEEKLAQAATVRFKRLSLAEVGAEGQLLLQPAGGSLQNLCKDT